LTDCIDNRRRSSQLGCCPIKYYFASRSNKTTLWPSLHWVLDTRIN